VSTHDATPEAIIDCDLIATTDAASFATDITMAASLIREGRIDPSRCVELEEILDGRRAGRTSSDQRIYFDCWGLGAADLALGAELYRRAKTNGIGRRLDLWQEPHEIFGL
jgi:ornithine cyclodeaminase